MQNLKITVSKSGAEKSEQVVTIPLTTLHVSLGFLPKKIKDFLGQEGIDLTRCRELAKEKGLKGTLIEISNANEKLEISID